MTLGQSAKQTAQSQHSFIVWLHTLNLCSIKLFNKIWCFRYKTQTFICTHPHINVNLLVHIVANFICKTCTISGRWISPIHDGCYFLAKFAETVYFPHKHWGNIYIIPHPDSACVASRSTYNTVDGLWTLTTVL